MDFEWLSDQQILEELGRRVRRERLSMDMTQEQLAEKAGVGLTAVKHVETALGYRIDTLIRVLRVLRGVNALDQLLPEPPEFDLVTRAKMREMQEKTRRKHATRKGRA